MDSFSLLLSNQQRIHLPKPSVMGVINMSPNSFYHAMPNLDTALYHVDEMVHAGVQIIDVGGEATNPFVDAQKEAPEIAEEIDRVVPIIQAIRQRFEVLISVDTSHAPVMQAAVDAGADIINDQRGLADPKALQMAAKLEVPVCLMHYFNPPREPNSSEKSQVFEQIWRELKFSIDRAQSAGITKERIMIDPGFGGGRNYSKSTDENFYLLARLSEFGQFDLPILTGWSRKSMIGEVLSAPIEQRLYGSIAAACLCVLQGAAIIRVHDVSASVDAVKIIQRYLVEYNELQEKKEMML